ncbi:uncharacterized protein LOC131933120 [Physella acuta]|uniref:uncharacterized protein LOC131933120 n=1 Tax=Physella acuta TaxID=109671 RepID=UPI0027DB43CD|nr:uncharacterized protein LOC131933120 [Physella acuta]
MDIVNYLVFSTNKVTQEKMRNYKSLKSYVYFTDGLVSQSKCREFGSKVVVVAKVKHSQKAAEKPVEPWLFCQQTGVILAAHCSGLVIHPEMHYIGASPDGLVTCDCCGQGVH